VDCPTCGAKAGRWCRRPSGHSGPMVAFHAARRKAAEAQQMSEAQGEGERNDKHPSSVQTYRDLKAVYPDALLFMCLGDFYEAFDEDAAQVARDLGVLLTSVSDGHGQRALMAGFPKSMADDYIEQLVERGHRVARLEPV